MNDVLQKIYQIGIVPVIALDDAKKAVPLAKALISGGLCVAEITFRTAAAEEAMRQIKAEVPEMLLGAGTVVTKEQADRAISAGAEFIVSPGFNPDVVRHVLSKHVLMCPGTATAGEMEQAMSLGLDAVKFFPAEENGGVAKLKALAGPYKTLLWMPTGGVNASNLSSYMNFEQTLACGGTWMVKKELLDADDFSKITEICRSAVRTMLDFRIKHVGINSVDSDAAKNTARFLCNAFSFPCKETDVSFFTGSAVEVMKYKGRGENGHIAIGCSNVDRAEYHMRRNGIAFDDSTRKKNARGQTVFLYLRDEIGGFAFHLTKN